MSEINSLLYDAGVSKLSNDTVTFSKKNAWKNEWEKAQLETIKNDIKNLDYKPDGYLSTNASNSIDKYVVNIVDYKVDNKEIFTRVKKIISDSLSSFEKLNIKTSFSDYSTVFDMQTLPGNQVNKMPLNVNNNIRLYAENILSNNDYTQGIIDNAEVKFGTMFKPQNINILMTDNGVKILLRDYRLGRNQLGEIIEEITNHLNEFGIKVNQVVVNGVAEEKI